MRSKIACKLLVQNNSSISLDYDVKVMSVIQGILWFLMKILKTIYIPFTWYNSLQPIKKCPALQDKILLIPAVELAEKIKNKEITVESVVVSYIDRIKEVNPFINAVVEERFNEAIKEAKYLDTQLLNNENRELFQNKPFLGVPFTVKESLAVQGLQRRAGSLVFDDMKCLNDAKVVNQLKQAGGIPLLVSNTPELCMNWETSNKITGRTNNPYDTRRTCGGSSGGEAALLGAGASVIGLGSDVGGSLRIPPHFCGVWGHKPTPGIVSDEGHFPTSTMKEKWTNVFTVGPMSRYATDLPLLLNSIVDESERKKLKLSENVDIKNIKVYYMETDGGSLLTTNVDPEIISKMRQFTEYLKQNYNINCEKIKIDELKYAHIALLSLLHVKGVTTIAKQHPFIELLKFLFCMSKATFVPVLYVVGHPLIKLVTPKTVMKKITTALSSLRTKFIEMLGEDGVFLFPNFPTAAHYHNEIYHRVFDTSYLAIFNELSLPSTNCMVGFKSNGLPIGLQAVTAPFNDRLSLRIAIEIEKCFGGWKPPCWDDR